MKYSELCSILHLFKTNDIELTEKEIESIISANDKMPTDYLTTLNGLMKNKELLKRILANKNLTKHIGTIKFVNSFIPECTDKWIELISKDESHSCLVNLLYTSSFKEVIFDNELLNLIMSQDTNSKRELMASIYNDDKFRKRKYLLRLIANLKKEEEMEELLLACENDYLMNNEELLQLIATQNDLERMREIRLTCTSSILKGNDEILTLITRQESAQKMSEVRLAACEIPGIINNKKLLEIIASQSPLKKMIQLRKACMHDYIREDEELLNLILSKNGYEEREEIIKACENEEIRKNREQLKLIAAKPTSLEMFGLRMKIEEENRKNKEKEWYKLCSIISELSKASGFEALRSDKEALKIILSFDSINKMKELVEAYCYGIDVGNQKLFLLMLTKDREEDMAKLRIKFEEEYIRRGNCYTKITEEEVEKLQDLLNSYILNNNQEVFMYLCKACQKNLIPIDEEIKHKEGKVKVKTKKN